MRWQIRVKEDQKWEEGQGQIKGCRAHPGSNILVKIDERKEQLH